jgi:hypothetical protein
VGPIHLDSAPEMNSPGRPERPQTPLWVGGYPGVWWRAKNIFSHQIDKNKKSIWILLSYRSKKDPLNTDQNHHSQRLKSTMRDVDTESTVRPQVVQLNYPEIVDMLCITSVLLACNGPSNGTKGLCLGSNFHTMKSQLSQLP